MSTSLEPLSPQAVAEGDETRLRLLALGDVTGETAIDKVLI